MELQNAVILKMIEFNKGDPKRIQHFLKVYEFTHLIALNEGMEKNIRDTLEIASIVHDIAIVPCERNMVTAMERFRKKKVQLMQENF